LQRRPKQEEVNVKKDEVTDVEMKVEENKSGESNTTQNDELENY